MAGRTLPLALSLGVAAFSAACGPDPECRYYNDCPRGSYCTEDGVCVADGVATNGYSGSSIPIGGWGSWSPCVARVVSVNDEGVDGDSELSLAPHDDVLLEVALLESVGGCPKLSWKIVDRPARSTIEPVWHEGLYNRLASADGVFGLDVIGSYRVRVDVVGAETSGSCVLTLRVQDPG